MRLAAILAHLLARGRTTRAQLQALTGSTARSARSDLQQLSAQGLVVSVGSGRHRGYALAPHLLQQALPTVDQLALVVGHQVTRFLAGTPLHAGRSGLEDLERLVRYVPEPSRTYGPRAELVATCLEAVLHRRCLSLAYHGPSGLRPATFAPANLLVYKRGLYLVGRYGAGGRDYALAVDRIETAALGAPFDPWAFDVDAWLAGRFGLTTDPEHLEPEEIVLRFVADRALLVRERPPHPSAVLETLRDGDLKVTLTVTGKEFVPYVLQWGPKVRVESPTWLREAVREELAAALRRYQVPDPGA